MAGGYKSNGFRNVNLDGFVPSDTNVFREQDEKPSEEDVLLDHQGFKFVVIDYDEKKSS